MEIVLKSKKIHCPKILFCLKKTCIADRRGRKELLKFSLCTGVMKDATRGISLNRGLNFKSLQDLDRKNELLLMEHIRKVKTLS